VVWCIAGGMTCSRLVLAPGAWAGPLLSQLGVNINLDVIKTVVNYFRWVCVPAIALTAVSLPRCGDVGNSPLSESIAGASAKRTPACTTPHTGTA
jgi:hypothetical protein